MGAIISYFFPPIDNSYHNSMDYIKMYEPLKIDTFERLNRKSVRDKQKNFLFHR
jgi:hypothetical protein